MENIYNYCYLYNIYTLINNYHMRWKFIDLTQPNVTATFEVDEKNFANIKNHTNKYLSYYQSNIKGLAENIIQNGMYFPFFCLESVNGYKIVLGNHRFYTLLNYVREQNISKTFLFLCIPPENEKDFNTKELFLYNFSERGSNIIIKERPKKYTQIVPIMDMFGGELGNLLFRQEDNVPPHPILNNEELFKIFINQPFDLILKEDINL